MIHVDEDGGEDLEESQFSPKEKLDLQGRNANL